MSDELKAWCADFLRLVEAARANRLRRLPGPPAARAPADVVELLGLFQSLGLDITDPTAPDREADRLRGELGREVPATADRLRTVLQRLQGSVAELTARRVNADGDPLVCLDGLPPGVLVTVAPVGAGPFQGIRPDRLPADHWLREAVAGAELYQPSVIDPGVLALGDLHRRLFRLKAALELTGQLVAAQRKRREEQAARDAASAAQREQQWQESPAGILARLRQLEQEHAALKAKLQAEE